MNAHLDSLRTRQYSIATPYELGIDQLLFAYGVRINKDLLLDKSCAPIEIFTTPYGNQRKLERFPWYFEPVLVPQSTPPHRQQHRPGAHASSSAAWTPSASTACTRPSCSPLRPTRARMRNPVRVSLAIVEMDMGLDKPGTPAPVGVLLEGKFRSRLRRQAAGEARGPEGMGLPRMERPDRAAGDQRRRCDRQPRGPRAGEYLPAGLRSLCARQGLWQPRAARRTR